MTDNPVQDAEPAIGATESEGDAIGRTGGANPPTGADAPELLDMIASASSLDCVLALPPERFRNPAVRRAFTERLRADRLGWENAKRERDA